MLTWPFARDFLEGWGASEGMCALSLPINPVKLGILVAWVYLCLYFVHRVEFSPLVPKKHKPVANVVTLLTGPILLFLLLVIDAARKSSESKRSIIGTMAEGMRQALTSVGTLKQGSEITLLDSSGRAISEVYGHSKSKRHLSSIIKLTEQIIGGALDERASDILIDPKDASNYTVRYRVDGVLRTSYEIKTDVCQAVINSIKALSDMDISERRRPQDGSFTAKTGKSKTSFRVASAGVIHGEKLSVRVLGQEAGRYTLTNVGLTQKQRAIIEQAIRKPSGMVLMCGPTGSGKTTTLYAMLNEIDFFTRNVITVEDPIEYVMPNCSQIEVNPKADITFGKSLRSILRQDPDVICVGEIRDEETAGIALRASQTGHLVLATIHCDTNASALIRLLDLGVSHLLIASGLSVLIAQRLLRQLCENCKAPAELSPAEIHDLQKKGIYHKDIYQPRGCDNCAGTGYRGRMGVFDVLVMDEKSRERIGKGDISITSLRTEGEKKGKSNLYKQGVKMVVSGATSIEELKRVLG
ncbi:MAG: GspE/PulE family protein [Planctomycetota bacterium]|jgi:type II secretory ATPase GspE/PulE/Tfp pilus assembly ATPase PilB-like protein